MKKINFKNPKYIFPLILLPLIIWLAYTVCALFGGDKETEEQAGLNAHLPEAQNDEMADKYESMIGHFARDEEGYTAMMGMEGNENTQDTLSSAYTDAEKDQLDREVALRKAQEESVRQLKATLAAQNKRSMGSSRNDYSSDDDEEEMKDYVSQYQKIQTAMDVRHKAMRKAMGLDEPDEKPAATSPAVTTQREEKPALVVKSQSANSEKFNTITDKAEMAEEPLIKAMIDKTTKAHEGTRLRFKLLDDVVIKNKKLPKGTFLYGVVTGFGQQRVMAEISSILVGNTFLKVALSVFDNDGMEGFYVPESAFRDFVKQAASSSLQSNGGMGSGSYGNEMTGESMALQALQNIYNAGTSAVSANIRKNRAKIKYNTIVYLINSQQSI